MCSLKSRRELNQISRVKRLIRRQAFHIQELLYQGKCGCDHGLRSDERRKNREDVLNPKYGSIVVARNCEIENIGKDARSIFDETRALPKVG